MVWNSFDVQWVCNLSDLCLHVLADDAVDHDGACGMGYGFVFHTL